MQRKDILCLFILLLSFISMAQEDSNTVINIKTSSDNPIVVGVVPFFTNVKQTNFVRELINKNFAISGLIKPFSKEEMTSLPYKLDQVVYNEWEEQGVEYILIGSILDKDGTDYKVELYLLDIFQQKLVLTFQGDYSDKDLIELVNSISDSILEKVTGLNGIFNTQIAYVEQVKAGNRNIYYLKLSYLNGSDEKTIFTSYQPIISLDWSSDNKEIAYLSYDTEMPSVVLHNIRTGKRQILSLDRAITSAPSWSPQGDYLVFTLSKNGISNIYKYDLETRKINRLTNSKAIDTLGSLSDDQAKMIFTSDRFNLSPDLMMLDIATKQIKRITKTGSYNDMGKFIDNDRIAFIRQGDDRIFSLNIYYLNSDSIEQLTFKGDVESLDISPNKEYIIYTEIENRKASNVRIYNLKTQKNFLLFKGSKNHFIREAAWSNYLK